MAAINWVELKGERKRVYHFPGYEVTFENSQPGRTNALRPSAVSIRCLPLSLISMRVTW
jgi:hypothetical protein